MPGIFPPRIVDFRGKVFHIVFFRLQIILVLLAESLFISVEFDIKLSIVIDIVRVFRNKKEGSQASVSDIRRPSLVVEVYRRVNGADYLKLFAFKIFQRVLVVFLGQRNDLTFAVLVRGHAVIIHYTLISCFGKSARYNSEFVDVARKGYGLEGYRIPLAGLCHYIYLDGALSICYTLICFGYLHTVAVYSVRACQLVVVEVVIPDIVPGGFYHRRLTVL